MKMHEIWNNTWDYINDLANSDDFREELLANNVEESDIEDHAYFYVNECLGDEIANMKYAKDIPSTLNIIVSGDLGLWNGRRGVFTIKKNFDWEDILSFGHEDQNEIFIDENNDLVITAHHHDGTNNFTLREITADDVDEFEENYYECGNKDDREGILDNNTKCLGEYFEKVHGWKPVSEMLAELRK